MKLKLMLSCVLFPVMAVAQDISFAKKMIDTLASSHFWGRGYTKDGLKKTADFLASQLQSYGVKPLDGESYFQYFSYPVNTFPGKMEVAINGKALVPGRDFIITPESRGIKTKAKLLAKDSITFVNPENRIMVSLRQKLTWSVAQQETDHTTILVDKKAISETPSFIKANIDNEVINSFITANVCGIVKGLSCPDSLLVITAHYDHLGGMGKNTYFPGANDNASGLSLLLDIANYYAVNPPPYSVAFICFSGEEVGLLGSKYFTQHPLIPMQHIRFLINLDLTGTGEGGITVVNATEYPKEFNLLKEINAREQYLTKINARGKAPNSDHYWFAEQGVPAFFIYTMGGIKAYHDVFDRADTLSLSEYSDLFKLIIKFSNKIMHE